VPIHGHLIEQGLLAYAKSRGKRPFFYDPKRSRGGADSNPHYQKVGERLAEWVRTVAGGIPQLTREQAEFFHAQAPDWQLAEGKAHRLERRFRFRGAYLPSKYPRINSRLRSLEAYTHTITAPPPRHYR
jgi:hypothetical protein